MTQSISMSMHNSNIAITSWDKVQFQGLLQAVLNEMLSWDNSTDTIAPSSGVTSNVSEGTTSDVSDNTDTNNNDNIDTTTVTNTSDIPSSEFSGPVTSS